VALNDQFRITVYGEKHAEIALLSLGEKARYMRPALEEIYLTVLDIVEETFDREGARGGFPKWDPITIAWEKRKHKVRPGMPILVFDSELKASVTQYRHPQQFLRIDQTKIVFASRLKRGKWHQKGWQQKSKGFTLGSNVSFGGSSQRRTRAGKVKVPARPFIRFSESDRNAFGREIMRHVISGVKGGR